jgi:iron complex outermembrane receptor protein
VRTPARGEEDLVFTAGVVDLPPVAVIRVLGHRELKSQQLLAWEAGYRARLAEALHLDLSLFYNRYRYLRTFTPGEPDFSVSPAVIPVVITEDMKARTYGGELAVLWQPLPAWHLQGTYTAFEIDLFNAPELALRSQIEAEGNTPGHQLLLRSSLELPWRLELDGTVRFVSSLQAFEPPVPSYWEVDARLGWAWEQTLELSLVIRNLLHPRHREFGSGEIPPVGNEIQRSVYGVLAWSP